MQTHFHDQGVFSADSFTSQTYSDIKGHQSWGEANSTVMTRGGEVELASIYIEPSRVSDSPFSYSFELILLYSDSGEALIDMISGLSINGSASNLSLINSIKNTYGSEMHEAKYRCDADKTFVDSILASGVQLELQLILSGE